MQQFSKWNKRYRYLLMVLDLFSKYGWIVPLKDKKGETVTEAFKTIFKEGRKPQYLWTDKGTKINTVESPSATTSLTLFFGHRRSENSQF